MDRVQQLSGLQLHGELGVVKISSLPVRLVQYVLVIATKCGGAADLRKMLQGIVGGGPEMNLPSTNVIS